MKKTIKIASDEKHKEFREKVIAEQKPLKISFDKKTPAQYAKETQLIENLAEVLSISINIIEQQKTVRADSLRNVKSPDEYIDDFEKFWVMPIINLRDGLKDSVKQRKEFYNYTLNETMPHCRSGNCG